MSGLYRSSSEDQGNDSTEISAGGRYALKVQNASQWFGQAQIVSTSFKGDNAPDDQTVLQVGGGKRYYFKRFSPRFIPYLSWLALLSSSDQGENKQTGVFYSGIFGVRIPLSPKFFVNFETNLFTSALTATEETGTGETSNKTTRTELYIDSVGGINDSVFSVGLSDYNNVIH